MDEKLVAEAKIYAGSSMVPERFKGKIADCFVVINLANALGVNPMECFNSIITIQGKNTFSAAFLISLAHHKKAFASEIAYQESGSGDTLSITASAKLHNGGIATSTVSMEMAKAEGWTKNPKYKNLGSHMLKLRSATLLIRAYTPHILGGLHSHEEIEDITQTTKSISSEQERTNRLQEIILGRRGDLRPTVV